MTQSGNEPPRPDRGEVAKWDPVVVKRLLRTLRPLIKGYHRSEVRNLDAFPSGGALVVSNHSGGTFAFDIPVLATDFYDEFGYDRPMYFLSHDVLLSGPTAELLMKAGFVRANHVNTEQALRSGAVVLVFPGGDYDVWRPTSARNTIDFAGRTGYVSAAIKAGVPIVPVVSIGGQENQLYVSRGEWLSRMLRLDKLARVKILPVSFGIPFGLSVILPINLPLPSKIVTQILEPIDVRAEFGADPDIDAVDAWVRTLMQDALDDLARQRRLPIVG
ncbi:lysophospholipid acyltransferase family protein [Mycobacterium kyogaense]|uniref:lysophospholipid acyltransferase family protein n=1 Tax=Mycobacterium kyogaense TaxID=2212479 RepID=UPI000DAE2C05|nr:lysophospholipid acyltransferase family protein [Mycobacterium kyogaense]